VPLEQLKDLVAQKRDYIIIRESYARSFDRRLLRLHHERRRGNAADQCDELAPFHVEHGDFLPYALSARRPTRALGFPAPQPATQGSASPWGRPELF
jgi:hypothetical protein